MAHTSTATALCRPPVRTLPGVANKAGVWLSVLASSYRRTGRLSRAPDSRGSTSGHLYKCSPSARASAPFDYRPPKRDTFMLQARASILP